MKKVALVCAVMLAVAGTVNAQNLLGPTWGDSFIDQGAGWGSGITWSGASATGITGTTNGGSYYAYQIIPANIGQAYTINGDMAASGSSLWTEVLMFSLDAGEVLDAQADSGGSAVVDPNVIAKIDSWGLGNPDGTAVDLTSVYYPNGPGTNTHVATSTQLVVALKVGASGGSNTSTFSNLSLTPEPTSLMLLGLAGLPMLRRRRA